MRSAAALGKKKDFRFFLAFAGLIGAAGAGAYLGAVMAGLLAVVTGQAFAVGSPWPAGAGVLALLGR